MKWMLLALMTVVLAACSGESLSPERKACLEKASTEAERIECNKESAIEADKKAEDADSKQAWLVPTENPPFRGGVSDLGCRLSSR